MQTQMTCYRCGVNCEVNYCFSCQEVISNGIIYKNLNSGYRYLRK